MLDKLMTAEFLEEHGVGWDGQKIYRSEVDGLWKYRDEKGKENNVYYCKLANKKAIIKGQITDDVEYIE